MSNVRGLADLRSEEKKDSSNEYYAGGANQGGGGSGMAVVGGDDSASGVDRVIGAARAHTSARQGDSSGPVRPAFTITFWKEGFQVDDGPLRSVETEENKQFVEQVGRGIVPRELRDRAENQDVDVSVVDKRSESFDPGPQPSYVAFSGEGQRLSGGPSAASSGAAVAGSAAGPFEVQLDESQPKSPVQIRTHDGRRLRQQFNPTHTVSDLQRYVQSVAPADRPFFLVAGFPPKPLSDTSATLKDADVLGSAVTQRLQ